MKYKLMLLVGLVSLMVLVAGCVENLAGNARSTGGRGKSLAVVTCPGGIMCDGTPVTGKNGQVV